MTLCGAIIATGLSRRQKPTFSGKTKRRRNPCLQSWTWYFLPCCDYSTLSCRTSQRNFGACSDSGHTRFSSRRLPKKCHWTTSILRRSEDLFLLFTKPLKPVAICARKQRFRRIRKCNLSCAWRKRKSKLNCRLSRDC